MPQEVIFSHGIKENFDKIETKDSNTIYIVEDTQEIYKGDTRIGIGDDCKYAKTYGCINTWDELRNIDYIDGALCSFELSGSFSQAYYSQYICCINSAYAGGQLVSASLSGIRLSDYKSVNINALSETISIKSAESCIYVGSGDMPEGYTMQIDPESDNSLYNLTDQDKADIASLVDLSDYVPKTRKLAGLVLENDITVEQMQTALGIGDIETALDSIIAIQENLIGGATE